MNPYQTILAASILCWTLCFTAPVVHGQMVSDHLIGVWEFQPQATRAVKPAYEKLLSKPFKLTFLQDAEGDWIVEGNPFGFQLGKYNITSAEPGGSFSASLYYVVEGNGRSREFRIGFRGKLNRDVSEITDGRFTCEIGRGDFTARKETSSAPD